jgi:hypothetical protein
MTLLNPRRERFTQELAAGKSIGDAYVAAGFKPRPANPSRLKAHREVSERVREILAAGERVEE